MSILPDGVLLGTRDNGPSPAPAGVWPVDQKRYESWLYLQAWLYTRAEFGEYDLHLEYWIPPGANSGISIRDRSRAHFAIGEADSARPELASFEKTTPAHIGYEIQLIDDDREKYPTGSVYTFVPAKSGLQRPTEWNSLDISRGTTGSASRSTGSSPPSIRASPDDRRPARSACNSTTGSA